MAERTTMMQGIISPVGERRQKSIPIWILIPLLMAGASASAGTICGTITDSDSGLPVAGAGIFARLPDGSYAGSLAVSDPVGAWCIADLAPGIYTLEVRVDDYLTIYRNGIEVTSDVSAVPISVQRPRLSLDPPWPNPATSSVNMRLHVTHDTAVDLEIFDLRGRLVRAWKSSSVSPGSHDYHWDGNDSAGRDAPSGLYLIRLRSRDMQTTRTFVLSR